MQRDEIKNKVIEVLVDKLGVDKEEITEETNLKNDLGMDSLDDVEVLMEYEKVFKIGITDEEAESCKTVKDIIDGLMTKIK